MSPKDRSDQIEQRSPLRLPNKIAEASPTITSRLKCYIKEEIKQHRQDDLLPRFFLRMATFSSLLPPHWESYPADLKMFLEKEMFDPVLRHVLETEGLINWCPSVKKLHPLITPGDGNCLLHAVSLAMWAVEDDELVLRTALYRLLRDDRNDMNLMRWKRERMRVDAGIPGSGLMYNTIEWGSEWDMVKVLASPEQRPATTEGLPFESLEQFHIFMLANMLRRPIIIVAQDMMRSQWGHSLQPQDLHGIYLPLNWEPSVCYHYPIILGFHQNHFTPLLCTAKMDSEEDVNDYLFPIVQRDLTRMPVHFLEEEEEVRVDNLLQQYLIIEEIIHMGASLSQAHGILGARLVCKNENPDLDLMIPYFQLAETHYRSYLEMEYGNPTESITAAVAGGKTEVGKDSQKPHSLPDQHGSIIFQQAKSSWSGAGAPVSQPSDAAAKAGLPEAQNPAFHRAYSLVDQSCKTEGCSYYRSVSTGEYCHECYLKQVQRQMCQGERCLNPAEQGFQDLCRVCFDQRKVSESQAVNATAPPLSKMSLEDSRSKIGSGAGDIFATKPLQRPTEQWLSSGYTERRNEATSGKSGLSPGQGNQLNDDLNSMIVHQKLPTKKCIVPECLLTGDPNKNDMCDKCYAENLQVVQEIRKSTTISQPAAAPASQAATSSSASALPQAASATAAATAASSDPWYPERKPPSKYTVQKNICATAGCEGVRLSGGDFQGFCFSCHTKNQKKLQQVSSKLAPDIPARNPGTSQSQMYPNRQGFGGNQNWPGPINHTGGWAQPKKDAIFNEIQPLAKQVESRRGDAQNLHINQGAIGNTSTISKTPPMNFDIRCVHPLCNNLAAPPKFLLCEQCLAIAELCKEDTEGGEERSAGQPVVGSSTQEPHPVGQSQSKESTMPSVHPPANTKEKTKSSVSKTASGFVNIHISRVNCQVPGGCLDDMFGDPELDNLCSRCFAKMSMRRTRNRSSPSVCHNETRPNQPPVHEYHTAPLNPSPRMSQAPPRANTEVIYINAEHAREPRSPKRSTMPVNFHKCSRPGCYNQANLQILEGFCNDCHHVYRQHGYAPDPPLSNPDPLAANRGRFAHSSQSTVPEAWTNPQGYSSGEEKILNIGIGPRIPPRAQPNRTDMGCQSAGCKNYGNPRCQGYCNSCFRLLKN